MYSNNSKMHEWKIIRILIPLGICTMVIGFIALIACYNTVKSYEVTITDKGLKDSKYMVFTKDEDEDVYPLCLFYLNNLTLLESYLFLFHIFLDIHREYFFSFFYQQNQ